MEPRVRTPLELLGNVLGVVRETFQAVAEAEGSDIRNLAQAAADFRGPYGPAGQRFVG